MTVKELCEKIILAECVKERVLDFSEHFDFEQVQPCLTDFQIPERRKGAKQALQQALGEDDGNMKILACMLKAAADLHGFYRELGISEEIYFATMGCFSRFVDECYERTGTYAFDREWWTSRQAGGYLFRIGALEYERTAVDSIPVISIHIPSDADFSREACDGSLREAKAFFVRYFPEYDGCGYICHSWLLAPELKALLGPDSNILQFQKRFAITVNGRSDLEFLEWVFHTYEKDVALLPEKTQLQKNMKEFLRNGGMLSDAVGHLLG